MTKTNPFTHEITNSGEIGPELNEREHRELSEEREKIFKTLITESTRIINNPHEKFKNDKTLTEAIPMEQIESGEIFQACADTDLSEFSPAVRAQVAKRTRNVVMRSIQELRDSGNRSDFKLGRKVLNTMVIQVLRQETEEPPETIDAVEFKTTTISGIAPETEFTFSISAINPSTNAQNERRLLDLARQKSNRISSPYLLNEQEIINSDWLVCDLELKNSQPLKIFMPKETLPNDQGKFIKMMRAVAGGSSDIDSFIRTEHINDQSEPCIFYMLPPKKYVQRAVTNYDGEVPIALVTSELNKSILHEEIHIKLAHAYGAPLSGIMSEGPTTYIEARLIQNELLTKAGDLLLPFNQKDILKTMCNAIPIEQLSWEAQKTFSQGLQGENTKFRDKEFVYPYARLFAEFFIAKHGQEKYYDLYGTTASKQKMLIDARTGKTLIHEGKILNNATQDEILEAGMLAIGVDPMEVKKDLYEYVRNL